MKKKIYKYLDNADKYAPIIAEEIARTFISEANDENIDYSFTISRKTGQICDREPNTFFVFDTDGQTVLHEFKKSLFAEDLNEIEEKSKEEEILMTDVREFLLKVCNTITNEYHNGLQNTVRKIILGNKMDEEQVPLKTIEVISIDIADYSAVPDSSKYMLKIGKKPDSDINTDEVIKLIQSRQEKTGMDIDTLFSIEKKAGNPIFKNVEAIILGRKFLNEISIYFFVDYSLVDDEEKIEEIIVDSKKL